MRCDFTAAPVEALAADRPAPFGHDWRVAQDEHQAVDDPSIGEFVAFRSLFEQAPDGMVLLEPHVPGGMGWPIVACNDAFCRMNGYTCEELLGQPIDYINGRPSTPAARREYLAWLRI